MDVRLKKEDVNISEFKDEKLNDSLIFNIIKKLELKQAMQEKYEVSRASQTSLLPNNISRLLHSTTALAYFSIATSCIIYLRYKRKAVLSFKSLLPHCIIAITINEYERYRNILKIDPELYNQFRSYQQNSKSVLNQMKRRVSLLDQIQKIKLVSFAKTMQMIKYRPIY